MGHLTIRTLPDEKAQTLARRLKACAPDLECRMCGSRDFGLIEDPNSNVRTILERRPLSTDPLYRFSRNNEEPIFQKLITLVCTRCGHLEQFAEAVLDGAKPEDYGDEARDE